MKDYVKLIITFCSVVLALLVVWMYSRENFWFTTIVLVIYFLVVIVKLLSDRYKSRDKW